MQCFVDLFQASLGTCLMMWDMADWMAEIVKMADSVTLILQDENAESHVH